MSPRPSTVFRLLIPVLCGLALVACRKAADADGESSRGLKVEAYDAPIPKAPLKGKLDTLPPTPAAAVAAPASAAASDAAPPQPQPPAPQAQAAPPARRLAVQRVTAPAAPPVKEPRRDLYDPPAGAQPEAAEAPGFHITVPLCRNAERQSDPLAQTPECQALLKAAEQQARDCARAFAEGNDKAVLSPGCRQAAQFR